jgi:hypothetical protein
MVPALAGENQTPRAVVVVAERQAVGSRGRNARPQIAAAAARA